jgi:hypothetical protein
MRKVFFLLFLLVCAASSALAQSSGDYNKVEVFAGYSRNSIDDDVDEDFDDVPGTGNSRSDFNGFNLSITRNVSRRVGLKFDFAGHYDREDINIGSVANIELKSSIYSYMGGVQFKDNSTEKRFKPFAHILAGGATARFKIRGSGSLPPGFSFNESDNAFSAVVGGGFDIRAGKRVDIRLVQVDYNQTRFGDSAQHNVRVGFGVVIHK